ncbi:hypothetical protein Peur_024626 [Populus x canadensis]
MGLCYTCHPLGISAIFFNHLWFYAMVIDLYSVEHPSAVVEIALQAGEMIQGPLTLVLMSIQFQDIPLTANLSYR